MDHHHHTQLYLIKSQQHEDKTTANSLNFRDVTVGASDDSKIATHLGMKH